MSRRVDALITTAARDDHVPLLNIVADRIPVVLAVRSPAGSHLPHVVFDDVEGGRIAAEHLLALGHRRIGQLRGPDDASPFIDRARGFVTAVRHAGAVVVEAPEVPQRPTIDEGARVMELLLAEEPEIPSAVFAHNDLLALGVLKALRMAGVACPDEIHIMGYDDTPFAAFSQPSLTTIRHPSYELGRMAADYAVMLLEAARHIPESLKFPPALVARESTATISSRG